MQSALHDDISEALGTSLTSPSPLRPITSHPVPDSIARPVSPTPTTKSVPAPSSRGKSPSFAQQPEPSRPGPTASTEKTGKSTWTSNLLGWNGSKRTSTHGAIFKANGGRRGSVGSIASQKTKGSTAEPRALPENAILDEVDEDAWRKGDGGSTPAIKAIVNATVSLIELAEPARSSRYTAHPHSGSVVHLGIIVCTVKLAHGLSCPFASVDRTG